MYCGTYIIRKIGPYSIVLLVRERPRIFLVDRELVEILR